MKIHTTLTKCLFCLIVLIGIDYLPVYAQKQKTKVTIIKETYDEYGNKTVQTIIKEGAEAEAIDLDHLSEGKQGQSLQWKHFDKDSLPQDGQFFNYSFKSPLDFKSFFDSLGMGDFNFSDQRQFPFFDDDHGFNEMNTRPKLGVRISEIESQSGVVITEVMPGTPAEKAGLREGDIIVSVDQKKIEHPEDLVNHIQALSGEEEVTLDIIREGDYLEVVAKMKDSKPKKEMEIRKI
ncbi:MAG: PDZ domain-containing protein [Saprospiraceae bacterium]|nr:PDZ domain-containing protein [Saprospiraceae bacterium]